MNSSYLINEREFSLLHSIKEDFNFLANKNYLFELPYLAALDIKGVRASEFLQGQLSCDLRKLTSHTFCQGAFCNLKGRILNLVDLINWEGIKLIFPQDLLVETKTSLAKIATLSAVQIEENQAYNFYGFYLQNKEDLLAFEPLSNEPFALNSTTMSCCYRLQPNLYIIVIKKETASTLRQIFEKKQQVRGSLAWHYLLLKAKHLTIYPSTRGLFLPHRLDLHLTDFLSFNKGCYKGQEIIARTHYRATLKHGLRLFIIKSNHQPLAGEQLFSMEDTELGEIIDFCPVGKGNYLIACSILFAHPLEVKMGKQGDVVQLETFEKEK